MATQSFTDFVGRGQQNLYQGSAPTATVLPQQEIQRLLAELRRGGARAQNAMRILQSTPEGRQAIQTVSAPAPAPAPEPVAPAPAPARPQPQTAQPTQAVDVQRPVPPRSTNIIGQTIGRGIGPVAREVGRGTGAFGRWVSGTSQSVVGTPGEMRDPLTDETFNTIENLKKGPQGLPTAEEIYKQVEETGDDLRSLPKAEQDLYIVKKQLESVGMDRPIPGRTVEEQVKNARDRLRSSFDVSPTTGQTRGEQIIRGGSNPAVLAQIAPPILPAIAAFAPGEVAGGLAVGQGGRLFSEATGIGDPAQFEQWGTLGGQFLGMTPKNPASILRQADEIAGLRAAGRPIQGAPGLKSALGLDFAGEELKDIARIGQAIGRPAIAGTRAGFTQFVQPSLEAAGRATGREALRQAERMPGGIPGVVQAAPGPIIPGRGEGFKLPSDLARSRVTPKFGRDAPAKNIVFESDFDRALYIATAKNRSARRDTFEALVREELQARGLDPNRMTEIAAPMRQAVQDAAQATNKYDVEFAPFEYADEAALTTPTTAARQADVAPRQAAGEPKLPAGLKRSSPRWKGKTIEWDSDVDKALYIVANPTTRSKAHDKFMDFLQKDAGLSEEEIRILGPAVRDSVTRLGNAEPGNVLRVPALRQGAPVRQPTATAREVAEEVTPRQLDMFSDPLAPRLVDDPVEAQVTARGAAQPVDTARAADVAPDVAEGIPPIPPIILKEGPFSVPIGDSGRGLEALQDAGTQLEVAFQASTFRKIGEQLRPISRFFDPSLASPESSIGKRLVIVLANLLEEGRLKADRAFTYVQRLGSRQSIFGRIDNQNKFVDGPFPGRTLNEVAENRTKPIVKRKLQSIKLNEVDPKTGRQLTAEDYVIRLQQLDEAASELARKYGAEIGFSPTDEVLFATREIYGKINSEGKVIKVAFPSQAARGKAKTALEHIRLFPTAREAPDAGYVLLPYDDVVKVKLQQAYRVGAEEEVAQYVLKNFDFEKIPAPDRTFEQQQAMFRGVVGTSEDAQKLARDYEEAAQSFISESKFRIPLLEAANDLGRTFELAGDASIFAIQMFFTLIRDMLLPVYGIRSPGRTARIPGSLFAGSAKEFARTFVTGLRDPERAKALNAKMIDEAREELTGTRIAIFSMPGESPEFTRGVGRLADLQEFVEGKVSRIPGAIPALRGATFPIRRIAAAGQEGYIAVQNMAGIYLYRALRETARKADGTLDPKLLNDVEDNINVMRGITSTERLGVSATQRSIENMALLAPRYRKAVLSMYKNVLQLGSLRGQLAQEQFLTGIAGMHLAGLGIVWAKGKAEGKSDERIWHEVRETLIPGGGSYFVTQAGDAMVGFGGKTISDIRFVANLLRAGTDPEAISRTIQNWIRGQISFVGQDFWTIGTGRGYMGEAVTPWARKQIGQPEHAGGVPVEEWGPGFGKWAARHGAFIWLQSMALDGGSASSRIAKGSSEFIGGRGYEQGKKQLLEDASWDRFEKPYSDLNLLERDTLKRDPEIGPQLLDYDLHQAKKGNKYAGYNVTKAAQKEKKERLNQTALDVLVQDMNDKSKVHAGNKMGGGVRDILKDFSVAVKDNETEEFYANKGHRGTFRLTGYIGKEPTNDFDRMLNDWYALYDKNTEATQQINWELFEEAEKAFIANLSPELAGQLQEWRDRESGVPGVEELKKLRGPKKDEQGNEIIHGPTITDPATGRVRENKQAGEPVYRSDIELAIEVWNVILASEQGEAGYTKPEMSRVLERDYGVETLPAYKGETLPPPVSVYGEPIVDPTR